MSDKYIYRLVDAPQGTGHPQAYMKKLAEEQGFTIVHSRPQSIVDSWEFWIDGTINPPAWVVRSDADFMMGDIND